MNILAIDTATEQCSAALLTPTTTWSRSTPTARGHADLILTMVDAVLRESGINLWQLDALAFGRGPGSFTGVRIAVSVAQGLALARGLPVIGISNLGAVAQQTAKQKNLPPDARVLVCMDARMQEVYWAIYSVTESGAVSLVGDERVSPPSDVSLDGQSIACAVGTGWRAYPDLRQRFPTLSVDDTVLPHAIDIAQLGMIGLLAGHGTSAADAQPVYLRDQVAVVAQP